MSLLKVQVAKAAVEFVVQTFDAVLNDRGRINPFIFGLGTGSTVAEFWPLLLEYLRRMNVTNFYIVPTSQQSRQLVIDSQCTYPLVDLEQFSAIDCLVDGFDAACLADMSMIKGGGAAHLCEKLVALAAKSRIYLGTWDKIFRSLGEATAPIPLEVLPAAMSMVSRQLRERGWHAEVRSAKSGKVGPVISDYGNLVMDLRIPSKEFCQSDLPTLEALIQSTTGVLGCGLFVGLAKVLIVANNDGTITNHQRQIVKRE